MATPSINDLVSYIKSELTGLNWNTNFNKIVDWFTDGTADITVNSVTGDVTGDVVGDVTGDVTGDLTGDVTGDIKATNGTIVLQNGTDGTNSTYIGAVTGDLTGNADTATALETGRTIGMTGDVVWTSPSFDGSGNVTATGAIQSDVVGATELGVTAGTATANKALVVDGSKNIDLGTGTLTGDVVGDLTGDVTGAIIGVTDGSSAAAGEVGEIITYSTNLVQQSSPVSGTLYDGLTGCTLQAGRWLVFVTAQISLNTCIQGSLIYQGARANLALTDNSNNIISATYGGYGNTAVNTVNFSTTLKPTPINITTPTTYKVRFGFIPNSGTPSVGSINFSRSESGYQSTFKAIRIG